MSRFFLVIFPAIIFTTGAHAQTLGQGVERVAVDDGLPRICIDATTDRISVRLDRIVVSKSKGWFHSDSAVDILIDGKVEKRNDQYLRTQAKMPVVFRANIDEYDEGTVVTSVSTVLMSNYPLQLTGNIVNLLEIDFSFINSSKPTVLTRLVSKLPAAAQGLPIPPTPYTSAFVKASSVLGGIIESVLQEEEYNDDITREGRISLEFNETGRCGRNGSYSGTYVFIKSYGKHSSTGIVSLDDIQHYCFLKFRNSNAIYVERKNESGECSFNRMSATRLLNPHFTLILSITNPGSDKPQSRDILQSGMALKDIVKVLAGSSGSSEDYQMAFDMTALNHAYTLADFENRPREFSGMLYNMRDGMIGYKPSPDGVPVEMSNFPSGFTKGRDVVNVEPQTLNPQDIVLNSITRCAVYGIDVFSCF